MGRVAGFNLAAGQTGKSDTPPVLVWNQSGGIAGMCNELKVWQNGQFRTASCKPRGGNQSGRLSKEDTDRLDGWLKSFRALDIENGESGLVDGLSVTFNLRSSGHDDASTAQRNSMMRWAEEVFRRNQP